MGEHLMEREIIEREIELNQENFEITSEVDIDVNKVGNKATVDIKRWDGSTKSVDIYDGQNGKDGKDGIDGKDGKDGRDGVDGRDGQPGQPGPANTLTIGSVTSGTTSSATITGISPNQVLNLVLQKGDKGDPGTSPSYTAGNNISISNNTISATGLVKESVTYQGVTSELWNDSGILERVVDENTGDMSNLEISTGYTNIYNTGGGNEAIIGLDGQGGAISMSATNGIQAYVPTPTNDEDIVTKGYVDSVAGGDVQKVYVTKEYGDTNVNLKNALQNVINDYKKGIISFVFVDVEVRPTRNFYSIMSYDSQNNTYNFRAINYVWDYANYNSQGFSSFQQGLKGYTVTVNSSDEITSVSGFSMYQDVFRFLNPQASYTGYFSPTVNGHPATKKYVDDTIASAIGTALGGSY